MKYGICFMFDENLEYVLLQRKDRSNLRGKLNAVGGKIEGNETPEECVVREIAEETGVHTTPGALSWVASIFLPSKFDAYANGDVELHCFSMRVYKDMPRQQDGETEELCWVPLDEILHDYTRYNDLAGYGEVPYLITLAYNNYRKGETSGS